MYILKRYSKGSGESERDCYIRMLIEEGNFITESWIIHGKYDKKTNLGRVLNKHNNKSFGFGTGGKIIINDGITELFIDPEEFQFYESRGFIRGRRADLLNWNSDEAIRKRVATRTESGFYDFDKASIRSRKGVITKRNEGYYESDTCINNALRMQSISALPENREKAKRTLIEKQGSVNGHMQTKDIRDRVMKVYKWDTPEGIKLSRYIHSTKRDHPDWILICEANNDEINTYGIYTKTKVNKRYRFKDPDGNEYIHVHPNAVLKKHPDWILLGEV